MYYLFMLIYPKKFLNNKAYKKMKTILIVFAVLLFLLTLLSSFGGSIRTGEPFYDATPAVRKERFTEKQKERFYNMPQLPRSYPAERFYQGPDAPMAPPSMTPPAMPPSGIPPSMTPPAMPPSGTPSMGQQTMTPPGPEKKDNPMFPTSPAATPSVPNVPGAERFVNLEKFDIPEPFFNPDASVGAPI
jgi:hypothetical protein